MSQHIDPYHIWLGIRPEEQPPSHYRLLGIALFEDNTEAIRDAAEQRMAHVRSYQLGPNSALSQKILNELAAAKASLLDNDKKAAYDNRLRSQLAKVSPPPPEPQHSTSPGPHDSPPPWLHKATMKPPVALIGIGAAVVFSVAAILVVTVRKGSQPDEARPRAKVAVATSHPTKADVEKEPGARTPPQPSTEQPSVKTPATSQPEPVKTALKSETTLVAATSPEPPTPASPPSSADSMVQARARLEKMVKEAKTASEFQSLGSEALLLSERAFGAGDAENGKAIATVAIVASRSSGDTDLMRKAALVFLNGGQGATPPPARPQGVDESRVDLLRLIDPQRDMVKGRWDFVGGGLSVSPSEPVAKLQVPYVPPEEYTLTVVLTPYSDNVEAYIGLAVAGVQFQVVLDGFMDFCGLDSLDGQMYRKNSTAYRGPALLVNKRNTVTVTVRKDRITVDCNGRMIIDFTGDVQRLSLRQEWVMPDRTCLFLGAYEKRFDVSTLELVPLSGQGRLIRSTSVP